MKQRTPDQKIKAEAENESKNRICFAEQSITERNQQATTGLLAVDSLIL